ncbi:MAG: hypothetical protein LBK95_11470 [Bifidobacteriaceae bacterium]|jgi:hypothetical protein|nr:hypothetical protein [Bifidobacteriaceae bacterium]
MVTPFEMGGQRAAGVAVMFLSGLAVAGSVTGCAGKSKCQSGAESSEEAVHELLAVAAEGDSERACTVTTPLSEEDMSANLGEIGAFVSGAGGLGAVSVLEDAHSQMGAAHLVEVGVVDSPARVEFWVVEESQRFLVAVPPDDDGGSSDEETSDPGRPPEVGRSTWPPIRSRDSHTVPSTIRTATWVGRSDHAVVLVGRQDDVGRVVSGDGHIHGVC